MGNGAAGNGQTGGKSGQQIANTNEEIILHRIRDQGWVRERELGNLTKLSEAMVGRTVRRLERGGYIFREKNVELSTRPVEKRYATAKMTQTGADHHGGSAERTPACCGYFLRLTSRGVLRVGGSGWKDVKIPLSWRHDALAIQTLDFLADHVSGSFVPEAVCRNFSQSGKIPDGKLHDELGNEYHFEQELSRKTGKNLMTQCSEVARQVKLGKQCYIAYPFPPEHCGHHDHEHTQIQAFAKLIPDSAAESIYFVRCYFNTGLDFLALRVARFEVLSLLSQLEGMGRSHDPETISGSDLEVHANARNEDELDQAYARLNGYRWSVDYSCDNSLNRKVMANLCIGDYVERTYVLYQSGGENWYSSNESGECLASAVDETFDEFVKRSMSDFWRERIHADRMMDEWMIPD